MVRPGLFLIVIAAALSATLCAPLQAQTEVQESSAAHARDRLVPPPVPPIPFSTDAPNREAVFSIEFRPADQMAKSDRLLAADAESSIAEHAGLSGVDFQQGKWSYRQLVCPALPDHLFLQYTRNNGVGDVTVFSASIPRGAEGRVRIVPILRRGYSLFSPAPINALTISAFNHIRAEERSERPSDWLGNGLCYAALAGAHPRLAAPDAEPAIHKPIPALTAIMVVHAKGGEVIRFADAAATPRPMEWTMTFNDKGKLIKATHSPAPMLTARPASQKSAVLETRTVPQDAQQ
jgi:hypothetical protein